MDPVSVVFPAAALAAPPRGSRRFPPREWHRVHLRRRRDRRSGPPLPISRDHARCHCNPLAAWPRRSRRPAPCRREVEERSPARQACGRQLVICRHEKSTRDEIFRRPAAVNALHGRIITPLARFQAWHRFNDCPATWTESRSADALAVVPSASRPTWLERGRKIPAMEIWQAADSLARRPLARRFPAPRE